MINIKEWREICRRALFVSICSGIALAVAFHVISLVLFLAAVVVDTLFPNKYRLFVGLYCISFASLTLPFDIDPVDFHSHLLGQHFGESGSGVRFIRHYRYPASDLATLERRIVENREFIAGALRTQMIFDPEWILVFNRSVPVRLAEQEIKAPSQQKARNFFHAYHVLIWACLLLYYLHQCRADEIECCRLRP